MMSTAPPAREHAVEIAASTIRYGPGSTAEVGFDVAGLLAEQAAAGGGGGTGTGKVLIVTDAHISKLAAGPMPRVMESLRRAGVPASAVSVYDRVSVEPTDLSFQDAIQEAKRVQPSVYVAVGGGSAMDTAKAANLYASHPTAEFLDFVNAPLGKGKPVPVGSVRPLIAVPTTAGTGSETTGVAIFDYTPLHAKSGIASRSIKPALGIVDPHNTVTMPRPVAIASGFDVLCHALESFTALPFTQRALAPTPAQRPTYQGASLPSDVWAGVTLRLLAKYFLKSVRNPEDTDARIGMVYASCFAGYGFGSAGCHLPHAMSYGISGRNKGYVQEGYTAIRTATKPLIPHGISVVLGAPAVFRYTAATNPARHAEAARLLAGEDEPLKLFLYTPTSDAAKPEGAAAKRVTAADAGAALADQLLKYMHELGVPDGLNAVGYTAGDVASLVEAVLPQKRLLNVAPAPTAGEELTALFQASMKVY